MWRWRLVLLNWVMTKIGSIPACRLLLIGMSMRRNLPPTGTAGLARSRVRGHSRLPCPPPRIAVTTFSMAASPRWRLDLTAAARIYAYPAVAEVAGRLYLAAPVAAGG